MLSVIIATYNRSDVLKQNLDCFQAQTDKDFEIVVGIDGSTDNTIEMLENYKSDFPENVIPFSNFIFHLRIYKVIKFTFSL